MTRKEQSCYVWFLENVTVRTIIIVLKSQMVELLPVSALSNRKKKYLPCLLIFNIIHYFNVIIQTSFWKVLVIAFYRIKKCHYKKIYIFFTVLTTMILWNVCLWLELITTSHLKRKSSCFYQVHYIFNVNNIFPNWSVVF